MRLLKEKEDLHTISMNAADLQRRTYIFAKHVREFFADLPFNHLLAEDRKQLLRASGSIGANYIEACEATSKKDFLYRIRLCRKEAREAEYWLRLLKIPQEKESGRQLLAAEANEFVRMFSASAKTTEKTLLV